VVIPQFQQGKDIFYYSSYTSAFDNIFIVHIDNAIIHDAKAGWQVFGNKRAANLI
jgi:hypothetical protein